jgi:hypothetical protein
MVLKKESLRFLFYNIIQPEISILCQFIHLASSLHKKATTHQISSGIQARPRAVTQETKLFNSLTSLTAHQPKSVSMAQGAITFTFICLSHNSLARYFVKTSIDHFILA